MPSSAPDRGHSPVPGATSLALVTMSVILGVAAVGAITALICSAFIEDLGPTVVTSLVFLGLSLVGFVVVYLQRRSYVRDVALGRVIVREPWSGADLLPPG